METEILSVTKENAMEGVRRGAKLLAAGEVVAFPTETVYGLGADALSPAAVQKIFQAKQRPADNPLIVHTADAAQLTTLVREVPDTARILMKHFWPGPLSIVFYKKDVVPDITTGGLDTVVVRCPAHPVAAALIKIFGGPIAAPSANTSGRISPTRAEHVYADLTGRIPLILKDNTGVECGLESTVVDCTTAVSTILRPGSITVEMLQAVLPEVETHVTAPSTDAKSPGMKYRHYSPTAPLQLFTGDPHHTAAAMKTYLTQHSEETAAVLWHTGEFANHPLQRQLPSAVEQAAPMLYEALRTLDDTRPESILVQSYPTAGIGAAIMNRLEKAATHTIDC